MDRMIRRIGGWAAASAVAYGLCRTVLHASRRFDFRGRVALVTGGSRGLGLVISRQLAAQGARVAICARGEDKLQQACHDIRGSGFDAMGLTCDVTDLASVERTIKAVRNRWGAIDLLINNAGAIQVGPMETMTLKDYERAMAVHFWGPLYTTLAVLPEMRQQRSGRIVNIASIGGKMAVPHLLPYVASKFALVGLSEGLRVELVQDGIYVTTVCPGLMRTGSHKQAHFKGRHAAEYAWFSISSSAPMVTMNAQRAAAQILRACRYGRPHVVLSLPAQVADFLHGIAPGIVAEAMSVAHRLLPKPGGIGTRTAIGYESELHWLPRWLNHWGERAARRNNELPVSLEGSKKR